MRDVGAIKSDEERRRQTRREIKRTSSEIAGVIESLTVREGCRLSLSLLPRESLSFPTRRRSERPAVKQKRGAKGLHHINVNSDILPCRKLNIQSVIEIETFFFICICFRF